MKEELSELFRIRGGWRHGRDGSNRPRRAGYRPSPASRDARGSASTGIANHARHGISTGKLEGFNNRIQVAKRIGYGYRDDDCFFTTIRSISIPDLGSLSPKKT